MSELSKPVICFSFTFSVDSTADGCAVTMENDKQVFVFGATRSNNNLSLLECFSVPKAGEYSVSVHEIVQKHVCTEVNNITVWIRESMPLLKLLWRARVMSGACSYATLFRRLGSISLECLSSVTVLFVPNG